MTTVGIIQPNFLPWRGYFDFISRCDVFVFLDDVQYTARDWRNRNRIRLSTGDTAWLTVPVRSGAVSRTINEAIIDNASDWRRKHMAVLNQSYKRTPYFDEIIAILNKRYETAGDRLSDFTITLTRDFMAYLSIATPCLRASELGIRGTREQRLVDIVHYLGGDRYLSGPAAKSYISPETWQTAGIDLDWMDYSGYPEYQQIAEPFDPRVSIIDLLFMMGPKAESHLRGSWECT
ncbi:WbqC family protein [uncultured Limimaricola sp.]|uniref:WbqC family protein n=1 Tax=uncultured Limimaricola sp. TaxID=2211667 RepID=UPI0030F70536